MIVAGFGCRAAASPAALQAAFLAAWAALDSDRSPASPTAPTALAGPRYRAPQLAALAAELGLPLIIVAEAALGRQITFTHSSRSVAARGCGSVCEAAALAAAGPGARLLVTRRISPDRTATCAIAQGVS